MLLGGLHFLTFFRHLKFLGCTSGFLTVVDLLSKICHETDFSNYSMHIVDNNEADADLRHLCPHIATRILQKAVSRMQGQRSLVLENIGQGQKWEPTCVW